MVPRRLSRRLEVGVKRSRSRLREWDDLMTRHDRPGLLLAVTTLTTFLSAALMFTVQPLFAKMVLPLLGGAPSVWAVALIFFQAALLAGYSYAHLIIARLPARSTGLVHLGLCILAMVSLPIALPAGWSEPPESEPYLWQLGLFASAIGLPFLAVAANAPLLQAWFARSGHPHGRDPYFLYAASNAGSLIALLSFPFVLEPMVGVSALSELWTWGYGALVVLLGAVFHLSVRAGPAAEAPSLTGAGDKAHGSSIAWRDRLAWIGLAFVPSGLLTAFTTHVATDVASAPLIWVIPLALYLLTFVVVFRERALIPVKVLLAFHLAAVILALLQLSQTWDETWYVSSATGVLAFMATALVAHRTLYDARPAAAHLTEFYLLMSLGGALGGLFAGLIAPLAFSEVNEYPLLLALGMACRPKALDTGEGRSGLKWFWAATIAGLALIHLLPELAIAFQYDFGGWGVAPAVALAMAVTALALWKHPPGQLAAVLMMCAAVILLPSSVHRGPAERSYFGVYRVVRSLDGQYNVLKHGTTLHGAQRVKDGDGKDVVDFEPKTYYHPKSPMAAAVKIARTVAAEGGGTGRFGIVGLGAGSLACLSQPGETWRFYEIDPVVVAIAKSPDFTYLANCQPEADIVIGDARLTLVREGDQSFDLLLIDAFSSDAVPMHLLTAEALALYAAKLKPSGIGVLHISNRYLDLEGVLAATLPRVEGLKAFVLEDVQADANYDVIGSRIVVFSRDLEVAHRFLRIRGGRTPRTQGLRPWSDDASDVLGPLVSRFRNPR